MKKIFAPMLLFGVLFTSCSKEEVAKETIEEQATGDLAVEKFIHRAMADWYLYEAEVSKLQEGTFKSTEDKEAFLASFDSPEELFEGLQPSHDKYSFMWDDYEELENMIYSGINKTEGLDWAWGPTGEGDNLFVAVRYVLPDSPAATAGLKRGDIFLEINSQPLTRANLGQLMSLDNYTASLGEIKDGSIQLTGATVDLYQVEMAENPVHIAEVLEIEGVTIGYLMYNGFTMDFDSQLNAAFADFKNANIDELVLDLRYNGGGEIETTVDLASMITGQFEGEVFAQTMLNDKWQEIYDKEAPDALKYKFNNEIRTEEVINSLNLSKVYVIATGNSASASELLINGLDAYIDVVHIGSNTAGKYQGSRTLYDSSSSIFFLKENVNPNHKYALQPLVSKAANANGKSDYANGLPPDIKIQEYVNTYGVLGSPEESLLEAAINDILGRQQEQASSAEKKMQEKYELRGERRMFSPTYQRMYDNSMPLLQMD